MCKVSKVPQGRMKPHQESGADKSEQGKQNVKLQDNTKVRQLEDPEESQSSL